MYRPYRNLALIILIAALLAACSSTTTPTPGTSSTPETTSIATAATTETQSVTDTPSATETTEATATVEMTPTVESTATTEATVEAASSATMTTTTEASTGSDCLVGTWKFADISGYLSSVLMQAQGVATYTGSQGDLLYTFGADGKALISAQDYVANFNVKAQNLTLPLEVHITGSADVSYTSTAPNEITFSDIQGTGLVFSATMAGQQLFSSTPTGMTAAFGLSNDPRYNTFPYECSATTLTYTPPISNANPITLERVP